MTTVASFEIRHTRYLDHMGQVHGELPEFAAKPADLVPLYRAMVLLRAFDAKAVALQRTGQLGTYASSLGQEAVGIGVGGAMRPEDVLLPGYRDTGAQIMRGVEPLDVLRYWSGNEQGSNFAVPRQDFPNCVPIATNACHSVGVAYAFKLRREPRVAVCMNGDGATSKGDFYEAINVAGAWRLPLVFVVNNNQWAISVPRKQQTAAQTLAQKAIAAGFEGEQVDGNDLIAVHDAARRALDKARHGGGPTLIEAITYRLCDHTTADDASRYRDAQEVSGAWAYEPIVRLRRHLAECRAWTKEDEEKLIAECAARVQAIVETYLSEPPPQPGEMFDHLHAVLPAALEAQRDEAIASAPQGGSHG